MNTRSIQFRLISWYTLLAIAVALVFMACTWQSLRHYLYSDLEGRLRHRAGHIAANILQNQTGATLPTIGPRIEAVYSPEANSRFIRVRRGAETLYRSGMPDDRMFNPATVPVPAGRRTVIRDDAKSGLLMVEYNVTIAGQPGAIDMGAPIAELDRVMDRLLAILLIALPLTVIVMIGGGYVLVGRALKPVTRLGQQASVITFGNLSNRLPILQTGDALERLTVTLNQMLERLETAYHQASRFSADASHELRTPLAIIRGELESLAEDRSLAEPLRDRVGSVLEETERMSHITESLFAISRLEAGEANMNPSSFDLASVVRGTAEQMMLLAEEKGQNVTLSTAAPVTVTADPARVRQVVVNLLDNAIKYTPAGGHIALRVRRENGHAALEIEDDGIGIDAASRPFVFDRFYRADGNTADGAGLGLSIVKTICNAMGATVSLENGASGRGTLARITLPLAEKQEGS
jgi:signal transduction histidine kinase